jgi:hypothetical protein
MLSKQEEAARRVRVCQVEMAVQRQVARQEERGVEMVERVMRIGNWILEER